MKILNITVSNILSFPKIDLEESSPTISFNDDCTILIGPNGAGKSNLIEIVNYILSSFFLKKWSFNPTNGRVEMDKNDFTTGKYLPPNFNHRNESSIIHITIECEQKDIDAMRRLKSLEQIFKYETHNSLLRNFFEKDLPITTPKQLSYRIEMSQGGASYGLGDETATFHNFYNDLNRINSIIIRHNLINPDNLVKEFDYNYTIIPTERILENIGSEFSFGEEALGIYLSNNTTVSAKETHNNSNQINSLFHLLGYEGRRLTRLMGRKFVIDKLKKNEALIEVNKYLSDFLDIQLQISLADSLNDFIKVNILKNGIEYKSNALSAGEKTILYYILTLCGKKGKLGFLIIDEPETNLHPQFHRKIKRFLMNYAEERNIQLLLSTHSHNFLDEHTIPHCSRIVIENNHSKVYSAENINNKPSKEIIRIINHSGYQNIFFTKKVILVEGDSDQYFFSHVLQNEYPSYVDTTEIIHVGGKHNHKTWMTFLEKFKIDSYFIGDFDNIFDCMEFKALNISLKPDVKKTKESMTKSGSADAVTLVQAIELFLNDSNIENKENLNRIKNYLSKRFLDYSLISKTELKDIHKAIESLYSKSIFILKQGDLEHYLNITNANKGLTSIIDFVEKEYKNWKVNSPKKYGEIKEILDTILGGENKLT